MTLKSLANEGDLESIRSCSVDLDHMHMNYKSEESPVKKDNIEDDDEPPVKGEVVHKDLMTKLENKLE